MEKKDISHNQDRYENIFNMYQFDTDKGDTYLFYNILNKITLPADLDESIFEFYRLPSPLPLTTISFNIYKSQYLWWLIMLANNIKNPVRVLTGGTVIKVIKPEFLDVVFDSMKNKI